LVREARIESWRKLAGLTIAEVAQLLDVSPSTWHRWITGKAKPERKHQARLDQWLERHFQALGR
jgi:transcriptional regulator with XRE-family HTH domain